MVTYYFRTIKDEALKEVESVRTGVWVHAVAPTAEETAQLIKDFSLDDDILEDAQDFFEVPRLERSEGAVYFFTRYPFVDQKEGTDTAPLLIVMGGVIRIDTGAP
jgi:Mg2+ and Co2+ transporter CorA